MTTASYLFLAIAVMSTPAASEVAPDPGTLSADDAAKLGAVR